MDRQEFFRQLRESRNDSAQVHYIYINITSDPIRPWTASQAIHLLRRTCFGASSRRCETIGLNDNAASSR